MRQVRHYFKQFQELSRHTHPLEGVKYYYTKGARLARTLLRPGVRIFSLLSLGHLGIHALDPRVRAQLPFEM